MLNVDHNKPLVINVFLSHLRRVGRDPAGDARALVPDFDRADLRRVSYARRFSKGAG